MTELEHRQPLVAPAAVPAGVESDSLTLLQSPCAWGLHLQAYCASAIDAHDELSGLVLPHAPNTATGSDPVVLWLAPRQWLVVATEPGVDVSRMREAALHAGFAACDVSDGFFRARARGAMAPELLAAGCALDLHPEAFAAGACARTRLGRTGVLLHRREDSFDLYFERSVAAYAWCWLHTTAQAVLAAQVTPI